MTSTKHVQKMIGYKYIGFYLAAVALYVAVTVMTPLRENVYHLSEASIRLIQVSFIVPIAAIWFTVTYGAMKFRQYAQIIHRADNGPAYMAIATALTVMLAGLLFNSLFGLIQGFLETESQIRSFTIAKNLLAVVIQIVIFGVMYLATEKLLQSAATTTTDSPELRLKRNFGNLAMGIGLSVYAALMLSNEYRNFTPDYKTITSFYLSDMELVLTIIIPYAIAWILALMSLHNINAYVENVKGIVYREVFGRVATGLTLVISFNILLGMLSSLGGLFQGSSLQAILIFVYVILICYGVGYIVIATGAKRLAKIEEV